MPQLRILLGEDDPFLAELLEQALARAGHRVAVAPDGPSALVRLKAERPDLLLLDLMLPGIDGFEVLRVLRADPALADLPVMAITSLTRPDHLAALKDLQVADIALKPLSPGELVRRVGRLVLPRAAA